MRPGVGLNTSRGAAATSPSGAVSSVPHSAWHSPVPYLFGGLAAMMGLIAFALLILACSYWKFSGYLDSVEDADNREADGEASCGPGDAAKPPLLFEEGIVVIMAGDCMPTFLATPIASCAATVAAKSDDSSNAAAHGGVISPQVTAPESCSN
ncbi:unnamed protein product [Musa acuminata subsp. malaccensis]|uniref:(wild Malaysian banana) hypothetical protein n=1 Tax=Musa acuminata subsp. malaccensis TaxID=214687 RepID=A0A804L5F8_MUSAM|nr:PREDICTED: protein GLUTAMINE DUMPER 3 [Musa acuminata subsp. malaccensis]CAG1863870.1 unnamed protein product [Musa acuminata subsp. malaccensis]